MFTLTTQEIVRIFTFNIIGYLKSLNSYEVFGQNLFSKLPLCLQDPDGVSLDTFKFRLYKMVDMIHPFYDIKEYFEATVFCRGRFCYTYVPITINSLCIMLKVPFT